MLAWLKRRGRVPGLGSVLADVQRGSQDALFVQMRRAKRAGVLIAGLGAGSPSGAPPAGYQPLVAGSGTSLPPGGGQLVAVRWDCEPPLLRDAERLGQVDENLGPPRRPWTEADVKLTRGPRQPTAELSSVGRC